MIILMNPVMCLNFEFCIYIAWLQIPEWWMFVIVGIYIFHIFNIFKICMTIASRRPRWISLKFGGGLHTSRMCVPPNPRPTVPEPWGNIGFNSCVWGGLNHMVNLKECWIVRNIHIVIKKNGGLLEMLWLQEVVGYTTFLQCWVNGCLQMDSTNCTDGKCGWHYGNW